MRTSTVRLYSTLTISLYTLPPNMVTLDVRASTYALGGYDSVRYQLLLFSHFAAGHWQFYSGLAPVCTPGFEKHSSKHCKYPIYSLYTLTHLFIGLVLIDVFGTTVFKFWPCTNLFILQRHALSP